jgi:hypothetical protein
VLPGGYRGSDFVRDIADDLFPGLLAEADFDCCLPILLVDLVPENVIFLNLRDLHGLLDELPWRSDCD